MKKRVKGSKGRRPLEDRRQKQRKSSIAALKSRLLRLHGTIELLEAEQRRFYALSGVSKEMRKGLRPSNFIAPEKPRRKKDLAAEGKIKSVSGRNRRHAMAREKWASLIQEIDGISHLEGDARRQLCKLWGARNADRFIAEAFEKHLWVQGKSRSQP